MKSLKEIVSSILVKPVEYDEMNLKLKKLNKASQRYYDRFVRRIAEQSDMYRLAEKLGIGEEKQIGTALSIKWSERELQSYGSAKVMTRDTVPLLLSTMVKGMTLDKQVMYHPFKDELEYIALNARDSIDRLIVHLTAEQDDEPIHDKEQIFKRTFDLSQMRKVIDILPQGITPYTDRQRWNGTEGEYAYYLCATSKARIAHLRTQDKVWEGRVMYGGYIDRKQYVSEVGRILVSPGVYMVFLECIEDEDMHSIVFGKEPFCRVPSLEDNLHALFTCIPKDKDKKEWTDGTLVHWRMKFAVEAIKGRYMLLSAKRTGKKE